MLKPGAVVTIGFPGVTGVKRRPAVVVSSATYQATRPDVIFAVVTSQVTAATAPSDYVLRDWAAAGLRQPSAFRSFLVTLPAANIVAVIGQLSERDWQEVQARLRVALAVS
jgi:mRNA interferase MazF